MNEDAKLAASGRKGFKAYITDYAATNASEDFAESIEFFINASSMLKQQCPHREALLHELSKKWGG